MSPKSRQVRLAFNATLTRLARLDAMQYAAVDIAKGKLEFRVLRAASKSLPHDALFPIMSDGGRDRTGRMITMPKTSAPATLRAGKYVPRLVWVDNDRCNIGIDLRKPRAVASPKS